MLELLASKHDDWVRIALSMTGNIDDAKDLVQDMYIRLDRLGKTEEQISYKDTVNRYFVWTVLFNMFKVSKRAKVYKKIDTCELTGNEELKDYEYDVDENYSFERIMSKISKIESTWTIYQRQIFNLYFIQGLSGNKIAKEALVPKSEVYGNIKEFKRILKEELGEDVTDYFNKDYDKI